MADAYTAALKGMQVSRAAFNLISENISNANNPNYSTKSVNLKNEVVDGQSCGVAISSITRNTDEFLQYELRLQSSTLAKEEVINRYNQRMQILFGQPGEAGTLNHDIDEFFNAMNFVANNPDFKLQTVQRAMSLTSRISEISKSLYQIRYDADREILQQVNVLNSNLSNLVELQVAISTASAGGGNATSLYDTRDEVISNIAEVIEINVNKKNSNITLTTTGGISLYDSEPYQLYYDAASGPAVFVNDIPVSDIILYPLNGDYSSTNNVKLVTGGTEGEVTTRIQYGKLGGLLQIRDKDIPEIIKQLDQLAERIRDSINAIHNSAGSVPASNSLTGTYETISTNYHQFEGKTRIAMIDQNGQPLTRGDGNYLNPLVLNLSTLDSDSGAGSIKIQTIVDEINQYFYYDPLLTKTTLGNLEDVRIASKTSNMVANGIFDFDFEVVNNSNKNSTFSIEAVSVYDNTSTLVAGAVSTTLPVTQPTYPGDRIRTSAISADFSGGAGGPYTIRASVKNIDEDGNVTVSVLEYIIDDTPAGGANIMNNRYVTNAVISGSAELVAPSSNKRFMQAKIVDGDGNTVGSGQPGFLKLEAISADYGIILDDLTSKEKGYTYSNGTVVPATNRGFAHFFQLNNLFVENPTTRNSAYNMAVREDIQQNSNLLSIGKLAQSASYIETQLVGENQAQAILDFTANPAVNSTITINGVTYYP